MRFSIVVVCLNPGNRLDETIESIVKQTFKDYEIVVKDGGSKDGSVERLKSRRQELKKNGASIRIYEEKDGGIYDAMNQAVRYCSGDFILFLNCGDLFYERTVLEQIAEGMQKAEAGADAKVKHSETGSVKKYPRIYYGNIYEEITNAIVYSNPHIDGFACYRNVPCHQCCFYDKELFTGRGYDIAYRVRADYEHFLWSFYVKKAVPVYLPVTVASYEGGGFSETEENRKRSAQEHKEITTKYMSGSELFQYRFLLFITLAPLRTKAAQSKSLSGVYNRLKRLLYRGKRKE